MSFIYVGRLDELKGIKILFHAWKQMGNGAPELKVCGTGPLESWCGRYISENGLNTISMLGYVPNKEVMELMANSEAVILPTQWYEGFPMTIIEAYSVGTPVIVSDLGNAGNVVEEGITGCKFKANSAEALVKVIQKSDICSLRENVIEHYKSKYTVAENYKLLKKIYKTILV